MASLHWEGLLVGCLWAGKMPRPPSVGLLVFGVASYVCAQ